MKHELEALKQALSEMRRATQHGRPKPHKPIILLSVLDQIEAGFIVGNRIYLTDELIARFSEYFDCVARPGDWCQPGPPFFHLRSSRFWHLQPKEGCEEAYAALTTSGGGIATIRRYVAYAYLDDSAFCLLQDGSARQCVREYILSTFFDAEERERLLWAHAAIVSQCEPHH